MTYAELTEQLRAEIGRGRNADLVLFILDGRAVERGFHVTEVLATSIRALDCGGRADEWHEAVLQLVESKSSEGCGSRKSSLASSGLSRVPAERTEMTIENLQRILEKSDSSLAIEPESKVLLEFRPKRSSAAQRYVVEELTWENSHLQIIGRGADTQCKAISRQPKACCAPKEAACC